MVNPKKEKAYTEKQRFAQFFLGGNTGTKQVVNNTLVEVRKEKGKRFFKRTSGKPLTTQDRLTSYHLNYGERESKWV